MEGVVKKLYKVYENKSEASNFQARTVSSKLCFGFTFFLFHTQPPPFISSISSQTLGLSNVS